MLSLTRSGFSTSFQVALFGDRHGPSEPPRGSAPPDGVRQLFHLPYRCAECGYDAVARVVGAGHVFGHLTAPREPGEDASHAVARKAAATDGSELVELVPCPRCGKCNPTAIAAYTRTTNIARVVTAVVAAALGVWIGVSSGDVVLALLCAVVPGGLVLFMIGYTRALRLEVPAGRVTFLTPEQAAAEQTDATGEERRLQRRESAQEPS